MRLSHPLLTAVTFAFGSERACCQSPAVERADAPQKTTVVVMPFEFGAPFPAQPAYGATSSAVHVAATARATVGSDTRTCLRTAAGPRTGARVG